MDKFLTYISLFSGAGIGCHGFRLKGYECIATNEILAKRLKIQAYNNKCRYKSGYIDGDIKNPAIKDKLFKEINFWKEKHKIKTPDVIIATPPCQGMSVANHKKKNEKSRNSLVVESIKITNEVMPKFFIFENVPSFLKTVCTDVDGIDKPIEEAIKINLGGNYNILSKIVNFNEYGSNSSRTRTLVIGVRKDIKHVTPYDVFPKKIKAKNLRQLIGDLPSLAKMGEISNDIFHSYRSFEERMLCWIENLKEGQSAFENSDISRIPHRVINGQIIYNKSKNADKYARCYWNKVAPCVHTRNDILASQSTIHPSDNRVFSIRELMRMMSMPDNFEWSNITAKDLNKLSYEEKRKFLKREELNIRHCLGEAVPTGVFKNIATNIKDAVSKKNLLLNEIKRVITRHNLKNTSQLIEFLNDNFDKYNLDDLFLIAELSNSKRLDTSAYFTRKDIVYTVVKDLPLLKGKKKIRILEPSAGVGNFLPLLIEKYKEKEEVIIDVCDVDPNSLLVLETFLGKIRIPHNFKINLINADFLLWRASKKYDIVVGNPPYKKLTKNKDLLALYKSGVFNNDTNNLFSFFIEKTLRLGRHVSLIVPKSILNAPEFNKTRKLLEDYNLKKICDYGEKAFKGVLIETVSFLLETNNKVNPDDVIIESYIDNSYLVKSKRYIFSNKLPYWLIYRNKAFDETASKMNLGLFKSFRDRQLRKSMTKSNGQIRVIKARNVDNNAVKKIKDYDCYIDDYESFAVSRYLNKKNVVIIPNLTYYPRGAFLPPNSIADGSVALLTLKNGNRLPTKEDLAFYSTEEFEHYYRIARNRGTRSLNIDNNSVFFFGLLKELHT